MDNRHLLPQAMLAGLLYQHACVQLWQAFLDGDLYGKGRWTYFPLAILYKTPVSELTAFLIAGYVLIKPSVFASRKNGIASRMCGNMRIDRMPNSTPRDARVRSRDRPYAAMVPIDTEITTVLAEITALLIR